MASKLKCKHCKDYFPKENKIVLSGINVCSKGCRRSYLAADKKKKLEKEKAKKVKVKAKKHNSISYLTKQADTLWSKAVKVNYNYKCQYEDCKKENLNSHHLYTRARKSTRWNIDNGMCLCVGHHTLSSNFSAHKTPLEFAEWLQLIKGRDWVDCLGKKSRKICNVTPDLIKDHILELKEFIKLNE